MQVSQHTTQVLIKSLDTDPVVHGGTMATLRDLFSNIQRTQGHAALPLRLTVHVGKWVPLADDVYSSGLNIVAVLDRLKTKRNFSKDARVATIWCRPEANHSNRRPDFFLYETKDWLVLPYELSGLALDEINTHKPFLRDIIQDVREHLPSSLIDPA